MGRRLSENTNKSETAKGYARDNEHLNLKKTWSSTHELYLQNITSVERHSQAANLVTYSNNDYRSLFQVCVLSEQVRQPKIGPGWGMGAQNFRATDLQLQELPVPSQPINPRPTHRLREAKHTKYIFGAHIMIIKMSLNENSASVKGQPPVGMPLCGIVCPTIPLRQMVLNDG